MEHIVQFAVGIDDERITSTIEEYAMKEITKDLKQEVANRIFSCYYGVNANPKADKLSGFSERLIYQFLEDNSDFILSRAAELLAEKLARSKAGKEILGNLK